MDISQSSMIYIKILILHQSSLILPTVVFPRQYFKHRSYTLSMTKRKELNTKREKK